MGTSRMTLTLTVKLSLSFANEIGPQWAPWPPARWCEENRNAPVVAFSHSLTVGARISRYVAHNGANWQQSGCAVYQRARQTKGASAARSNNLLLNVLDARATSPCENS